MEFAGILPWQRRRKNYRHKAGMTAGFTISWYDYRLAEVWRKSTIGKEMEYNYRKIFFLTNFRLLSYC